MRLLVVRVGAMGDVLHALPAVAALRRARPEAHIAWAIDPRWRPLLENSLGERPLVDHVHDVETRLWKQAPLSLETARSVTALRGGLRAERYDLCVDLQGSLRSAAIGWMAGARQLAGYARPRETPARYFYGRRIGTEAVHVVDQAAEVLGGAVGITLAPEPPPLPHEPAADAWAAELAPAGQRAVLLVPQAGWGAKEWPSEHYAALARSLAAASCRVLVNATASPDVLAEHVVAGSGGAAIAVRSTLPELLALCRRMALVVAGDTGPLHLAAALGRPVLGLFGPTDPRRTGPWGGGPSRTMRDAASVTDHRRHAVAEAGLQRIAVEDVAAAAIDLLGAGRGTPGVL